MHIYICAIQTVFLVGKTMMSKNEIVTPNFKADPNGSMRVW